MYLKYSLTLLFCFCATSALAKGDPKTQTDAIIEAFKNVKSPPEEGKLSDADRKHNKGAFKALDAFFDYHTLTINTVKKNQKAFKKGQLKKFQKMLEELIRMVAYPDSGAFLNEAQITVGAAKINGNKADVEMEALLEEEDFETVATYHWHKVKKQWKLFDVSFDGDSLIKDYQNQFGGIIKEKGVKGLVDLLNKRHAKEKAKGNI